MCLIPFSAKIRLPTLQTFPLANRREKSHAVLPESNTIKEPHSQGTLVKPLTPEQQKTVVEYVPQVKVWIIDRYPIWTFHRDTVEASAFNALCQAIASWKGGAGEDRDKYVWAAIHNSRKEAWRRENKHQADRDKSIDVAFASAPDDRTLEVRELVEMMPEQEAKIIDLLAAGFTGQEIKDVLGTKQATTYRRITDARKSFEKMFGE
jgi:hypothetical protein